MFDDDDDVDYILYQLKYTFCHIYYQLQAVIFD